MKKFLASILTGALVCTACIGMTACGSSYSETYTGYVSEESYETVDETLEAFLDAEISGKTVNAELVSYTKEKELSESEISSLSLGDEYTADIVSVEKGTIEYTDSLASASVDTVTTAAYTAQAETVSGTSTIAIYVIKYETNGAIVYRYYTAPLSNGETLTSSYYTSTFDLDKYINCTMEIDETVTYSYDGEEMSIPISAVEKITENSIYAYTDVATIYGSDYEQSKMYVYTFEQGDKFYGAVKADDDDYIVSEITYAYASIDELLEQTLGTFFDTYFGNYDHTYFEKTNTGYSIRDDKTEAFAETAYGSIATLDQITDCDFSVNISDGHIADATISLKLSAAGISFNFNCKYKFYDFGTTTVEIPDEVLSQIN